MSKETHDPNLPWLSDATVETLRELHGKGTRSREFLSYVKSLRENKWPLRAISVPLGVSRSIVSDWERLVDWEDLPETEPLPEVERKLKPVYSKYKLTDEQSAELLALAEVAKNVSRFTDHNAPSRVAARKLEALLREHKAKGASYQDLATACHVTRRAIAQRLEKTEKEAA